MLAILYKEFNAFLNTLTGYVVIGLFLVGTGLFTWVFSDTSVLEAGYADLFPFFSVTPYVYLFLIPAVTMRSFAEEKKSGTLEFLFTKPLADRDILLGKFLACWALVALALLPTLVYYFSLYYLGSPTGNIDTASVIGSYMGMLLLGAAFTAMGIFASSLTDSQIVSFIVALVLCYLLYDGFDQLAKLNFWSDWRDFVAGLGISYHYRSLSKGLIDSRDLAYFAGLTAIALLSTHWNLRRRFW